MASFVSRLVACLVAVVAVLQLVHLVLLNKLEKTRLQELQAKEVQEFRAEPLLAAKKLIAPAVHHVEYYNEEAQNEEPLINRLSDDTIVDSSGEFRIIFDIAGPIPGSVISGGPPLDSGGFPTSHTDNDNPQHSNKEATDDFSIDDENFESLVADVTLVTQSDLYSARRFLLPLMQRWGGPVSLTLYASTFNQIEKVLKFIAQVRRCDQLTKQYVSFHLVFPLVETYGRHKNETSRNGSKKRKHSESNSDGSKVSCHLFLQELATESLKSSAEVNSNSYESGVYPINLLRNVGRKKVMTEFLFVIPIDLLPSAGLRSKFQNFINAKESVREKKVVYVVPAFESKNDETPKTKRELLTLIDKYQVRPFNFDLCWKCQVHTDYESWQRERSFKEDQLSILFEVLWKDPWEPFYISDNFVADFDERFRQHGYNRISQLCELHMAGYKFAVLNDAFLIHKGYTVPQPFPSSRSKELETNRINYRQFKTELKIKYPHATRRCY